MMSLEYAKLFNIDRGEGNPTTRTEEVRGFKSPHLHPTLMTSGNAGRPGLSPPRFGHIADGERLTSWRPTQGRTALLG